jgi:hypothetical protein
MKASWKIGLVTAGVTGVLFLGACGSDSGPSTDTSITQSQATVVGTQVADQAAAIAAGLGNFQLSTGGLGQGFFAPSAPGGRTLQLVRRMAGPRAARLFLVAPPPDCTPGVAGDSSDTDLDGIPNNVIYTFSSSNCSYATGDTTGAGDSLRVTVTGTVALQDTDDSDTFFGYGASFGQWKFSETDGIDTISVRLNGTTTANVGTAAVAGSDHYSVTLALGPDNVTVSQNWDAGFDPNVGEVIDSAAASLPPGKFALNGVFGFNGVQAGESGDWSFTLTTTDSLVFDPACGDDNQLVGGSLRGAITAKNSVGFTIDFQNCGVLPTVTAYDGAP